MMRALYSSVGGLRIHQTKMDVIGNNISNVNTVGFKSSSVTFTDVLYQTTKSASGPNAETGKVGTNAMQIGLGATVGAITSNMKSGSAQNTGGALDVMINGDAFFVVSDGASNYFTKAGSFTVDAKGTLCTNTGYAVMGWKPNEEGTGVVVDEVQTLDVMSDENLYTPPEATSKANFSGNIDRFDKQLTDGKKVTMPIYDNLGNKYTVTYLVKDTTTDADGTTNKYEVTLQSITDVNGDDIKKKNFDYTLGDGTSTALTFNGANGKLESVGNAKDKLVAALKITGEPNPFNKDGIEIDFSLLTAYSTNGTSTMEAKAGGVDSTGAGKAVGNMKGISIDQGGQIFGTYDNGDKKLLGQISVATFSNPSGLEAVGNSLFTTTMNSGEFNKVGKNILTIGGTMSSGVLEMSNVDLANEFTELIVAQRGFQANSRIISTADSLLEELINLKR